MKVLPVSVVLIAAISCNFAPAFSAVWLPVGSTSYEIDGSGVQVGNDRKVYAWTKSVMTEYVQKRLVADLREEGVYVDFSQYSYSLSRWSFDCKARTSAVLIRSDYNEDGEVVNSFDFPTKMTPVIPDSVGEAVLESACTLARGRRR